MFTYWRCEVSTPEALEVMRSNAFCCIWFLLAINALTVFHIKVVTANAGTLHTRTHVERIIDHDRANGNICHQHGVTEPISQKLVRTNRFVMGMFTIIKYSGSKSIKRKLQSKSTFSHVVGEVISTESTHTNLPTTLTHNSIAKTVRENSTIVNNSE